LSLKEIASWLHLSRETVKSETATLYRKLEVHSRGEAVVRARECGLLPPHQGPIRWKCAFRAFVDRAGGHETVSS